ncbi:hypothetical protein GW17_00046662 [Ensete ventricosum]|nr:hypothetical protein GW17_00046662 [Ensete ventricosum]
MTVSRRRDKQLWEMLWEDDGQLDDSDEGGRAARCMLVTGALQANHVSDGTCDTLFFVLIFAAHMMHPLRFSNNGIRVMVFVRKISFKLRVMRLNCVELFYGLVVAIGIESRHCLRGRGGHMHAVYMQRWLATARHA